jgi:hypothetical protein
MTDEELVRDLKRCRLVLLHPMERPDAPAAACEAGPTVLVATVSNACPVG